MSCCTDIYPSPQIICRFTVTLTLTRTRLKVIIGGTEESLKRRVSMHQETGKCYVALLGGSYQRLHIPCGPIRNANNPGITT